jgi:hypothetical protein
MRAELVTSLDRLSELFATETEALRLGMEGELEQMLRAAETRLNAVPTTR